MATEDLSALLEPGVDEVAELVNGGLVVLLMSTQLSLKNGEQFVVHTLRIPLELLDLFASTHGNSSSKDSLLILGDFADINEAVILNGFWTTREVLDRVGADGLQLLLILEHVGGALDLGVDSPRCWVDLLLAEVITHGDAVILAVDNFHLLWHLLPLGAKHLLEQLFLLDGL